MTDDAFAKALEQQDAAIASMLNGDPGPMIDSWAASDDITLFGAWGPVEKGHKPVTDTMRWVGSRFNGADIRMRTGKGRGPRWSQIWHGVTASRAVPSPSPERVRLVVGIWLILLTVILLSEGYLGWALLTGAGAIANFGLARLASRRISV